MSLSLQRAVKYNESISDSMVRLVSPALDRWGLEYWITEAAEFGNEKWEDARHASSLLSRVYADLNHLCNAWFFNVGIQGVESNWRMNDTLNTALYLLLYRKQEKDWAPLLKYYYLKQMNHTITPGSAIRQATTDLLQVDPRYSRTEDSTMVYAFCDTSLGQKKAPLYLGAGVNPDGSWGIGLTNFTSDGPAIDPRISDFQPTENYKVTVIVEELDGQSGIPFAMYRCNADSPYIHFEGSVLLDNGRLVIDSIGPFDMITLRSSPGVTGARYTPSGLITASSATLQITQAAQNAFHIDLNTKQSGPIYLKLYNLHKSNQQSGLHRADIL